MKQELEAAARELVGNLSVEELASLGLGDGDASASPGPSPPALRKRRQRLLDRLRIAWRRVHDES
jgi:hypothetical protein